jgi:hypothetical protein
MFLKNFLEKQLKLREVLETRSVAHPHQYFHFDADPNPNFILMLIRIRFLLIIILKEICDQRHLDPPRLHF